MRFSLSDKMLAYLLLLPAAVILFFVLLFPIVSTLLTSFGISLTRFDFTFAHYIRLFNDPEFWNSFKNTLIFVPISVIGDLILGLSVALLLNQAIKGKKFFRLLVLLPWMIPSVVTAATWRWMYNPVSGILNSILLSIGLIDEPLLWLSSKSMALISIIFANIWRGFPYVMLVMLTSLQSIDTDIYEAGAIDGVNTWQKFAFLTLPNLKKSIIVVLALTTVWEFRQIDLVKTMTGGGPGSLTEVLVTFVFKQYFQFFQFEYASAIAVVMSVIMLIISIPYIKGILAE